MKESMTREFGIIVEMDELDEESDVKTKEPGPSSGSRSRKTRDSIEYDHVNAQSSRPDLDSVILDDASTVRSSRRASQYSIVDDSPGAGPLRVAENALLVQLLDLIALLLGVEAAEVCASRTRRRLSWM